MKKPSDGGFETSIVLLSKHPARSSHFNLSSLVLYFAASDRDVRHVWLVHFFAHLFVVLIEKNCP